MRGQHAAKGNRSFWDRWGRRVVLVLSLTVAIELAAAVALRLAPDALIQEGPIQSVVAEVEQNVVERWSSEPPATEIEEYASWDSTDFRVSLRYPALWQAVYPRDTYVGQERVQGVDGFFQILSFVAAVRSAEEICQAMAEHKLRPYGSAPTVRPTTLQGQDACYVWPSEDQPGQPRYEVLLVVRYPWLPSRARYPKEPAAGHLGLLADPAHIQQIASTLAFRPDL